MNYLFWDTILGALVSGKAEFKSTRSSNLLIGVGLLLIPISAIYLTIFRNEHDLLNSHARRGGVLKLLEQTIGWESFVILMLLFGAWATIYSIVSIWKFFDGRPDITALSDRLEFHPAVRSGTVNYDEISHWSVEFVSGHPVLWLHFFKPYWSLQGLFKRKTIKLEGSKEQLDPLLAFFASHHIMQQKFA